MRIHCLFLHTFLSALLISAPCFAFSSNSLWSGLTFFERQTLSDLPNAERGDPDALLALFMLASGTRDLADYENARRRVMAFKRDFDESVIDKKQHWFIGEQLNRRMHDAFFLKHEQKGKAPSGYALDQSRLAGIFETGEYNCISASLLYAVLTRLYDIPTEGILLPSHAFIQISAKGRSVDVETTSPDGYDQKHDKAFYDRGSDTWHENRGLSPATYDDYLNRKQVSLAVLAAQNMLNQHTAAEHMSKPDRYRLAEISAYIDPSNAHAQMNRLAFYLDEARTLVQAEQWQRVARLADTVFSTVHRDHKRLAYDADRETALAELQSMFLLGYAHNARAEPVLAYVKRLVSTIPKLELNHQTHLAQNLMHAVGIFVKKQAEEVSFDDGLVSLALLEHELQSLEDSPNSDSQASDWQGIVAWYYLHWAGKHWKTEDWFSVTDVIHDYFARSLKQHYHKEALKVLTGAYANWGRSYLSIDDLVAAQAVLQGCNEASTDVPQVCRLLKKDIQSFKG